MKNRKAVIRVVIFLVLITVINQLANYMLVQPGLGRTMFHEVAVNDYDNIIVGASHGSYGLSSQCIDEETGFNTMNMCMGGEYMRDAYNILKFSIAHNKNVKNVILDVDYQYIVNYHAESILQNTIYNAYPNGLSKLEYYFDKIVTEDYRGTFLRWTNFWQCYKYIPKTIKKKQSEAYKNYDASVVDMNKADTYMGNGFTSRSRTAKKDTTGPVMWSIEKVSDSEVNYMKKMVELCRSKNINIIFTTVCADPQTIADNIENYRAAHEYIDAIAKEAGVTYLDFNYVKQDVFERTTDDYYDREGHMYGDTAERFSHIYGKAVKSVIEGNYESKDYFDTDLNNIYK